MFPRALYMLPLRYPSDTSGAGGEGDDAGDDKGTGGDDAKLKDTPAGDEQSILDHLDNRTAEEKAAEEKAAADKKAAAGEAGDDKGEEGDKPTKLTFKDRPDWLQEPFWDKKTGEVDVQALSESHNLLKTKLSRGEHNVPKDPESYKLELPDDLKDTEARALLNGSDDPVVTWFRKFAHEEKFSEATAAKAYEGFMRVAADLLPEEIDPKMVVKRLGPNALGILRHTENFGLTLLKNGTWNQEEFNAHRAWLQDEVDITAFQKLRESYGERTPPLVTQVPEGAMSRAELRQKMGELVKAADAGDQTAQVKHDALMKDYEKLYGTEPAGTSLQG